MSLNAIGFFAYNFNIFASKQSNNPWDLVDDPVWSIAFLLIAGYLSILACSLLLKTVELHYTEQRGNELIPQNHQEREGVLNLPSLLNRSAPNTCTGTFLYVVFLMLALTMLFRFSLFWSLLLAEDMDLILTDEWSLPNWLVRVMFILLLFGCAFSFYWLQYFQIGCVLCYILMPLWKQNTAQSQGNPWVTPFILFAMFVQLFSNQLNVMSVVSAAPAVTTQRQDVFLKWAVGLIIVDYLLIGLIFNSYGEIWEKGWVNTAFTVVMVLCEVSSVHTRVRTLTDVIVAWRYGQRSHEVPRFRAKIVPFAIVAVLIILTFLIRQADLVEVIKCRSYLLVSSLMLIIIPYCYHYTVERMMGQGEFKLAPKWWSYALYAGGVCSLIGFFGFLWRLKEPETMNTLYSFGIDLGLAVLLLLWHFLGRYLP